MTNKPTNKFSPEIRERSVRMVLDHEANYPSRWTEILSVAQKIGCASGILNDWIKENRGRFRQACRRSDGSGGEDEGPGNYDRPTTYCKASAYSTQAELDSSFKR